MRILRLIALGVFLCPATKAQDPPKSDPPRTVPKQDAPADAPARQDLDDPSQSPASADPTRPAMLALDFKDRPLHEVVAAISARSGNAVILQFQTDGVENLRKVTLVSPTPVPFWEAMDRLAGVTKLQRSVNDGGGFGGRRANVSLYGPGPEPGPAVYSGPFRFGNFTLHADYETTFVPTERPSNQPDPGPYRAEFEALAEPRAIAIRTGPLAKLEAIDDRGRSLLDPALTDPEKVGGPVNGYALGPFQPNVRIRLRRPEPDASRLKRLRGVMPVEVGVTPATPTLIVPLADSVGKTFRAGDLAITIEEFAAKPGRAANLKVMARIEGDRGPTGKSPRGVVWARSGAVHRQIEIADAQGRPLASGSGGSTMGDELRFNYSFPAMQRGLPGSAPTHLRVYAPKWVQWEAPFEFSDVALP